MTPFEQHCRDLQEREYADVFRLLHHVLAPRPRQQRLVLTKSVVTSAKRKPIAKKPILAVFVPSKLLTDRELLGGLSDAVARGWLTGHDALAAEKLVQAGQPLPTAVRNAILGKRG